MVLQFFGRALDSRPSPLNSMEHQEQLTEKDSVQLLEVIGAEDYEQIVRAHEEFITRVEELKKLGEDIIESLKSQWSDKLER